MKYVAYLAAPGVVAALAETAAAVTQDVGDRLGIDLVDPPAQVVFDKCPGEPSAGLVD